jgi:hypothetical protein
VIPHITQIYSAQGLMASRPSGLRDIFIDIKLSLISKHQTPAIEAQWLSAAQLRQSAKRKAGRIAPAGSKPCAHNARRVPQLRNEGQSTMGISSRCFAMQARPSGDRLAQPGGVAFRPASATLATHPGALRTRQTQGGIQ